MASMDLGLEDEPIIPAGVSYSFFGVQVAPALLRRLIFLGCCTHGTHGGLEIQWGSKVCWDPIVGESW